MKPLRPRIQRIEYAIEVEGVVDERWSEWFDEGEVTVIPSRSNPQRTTLVASLPDQSALPALLARVTGLNLRVISVSPQAPGNSG